MEVVVQIEKFFHRTVFALDELNVVDDEQVVLFVLLFEHVVAVGAYGAHKAAYIVVGVHVTHFGVGAVFQQLVADGLYQMGFAQAGAAVEEKRVVALAGIFGDGLCGGGGDAVAFAFHQRFKSIVGRQVGLAVTRFRRAALFVVFGFCSRVGRRRCRFWLGAAVAVRQVFHAFGEDVCSGFVRRCRCGVRMCGDVFRRPFFQRFAGCV